ncbi:MAG: hypothetical protein ACXWKC_21235 [Xanthobacteraceae bacterium]
MQNLFEWAATMTIADITLAAFTLCNSLRVVAYVPQIAKAFSDRSGAQAISFGTWGLFLVSHSSAMAYAVVNKADGTMAFMFLLNAIGCGVILLIAAWRRSQHRALRIEAVEVDALTRTAVVADNSVVGFRRAA